MLLYHGSTQYPFEIGTVPKSSRSVYPFCFLFSSVWRIFVSRLCQVKTRIFFAFQRNYSEFFAFEKATIPITIFPPSFHSSPCLFDNNSIFYLNLLLVMGYQCSYLEIHPVQSSKLSQYVYPYKYLLFLQSNQ